MSGGSSRRCRDERSTRDDRPADTADTDARRGGAAGGARAARAEARRAAEGLGPDPGLVHRRAGRVGAQGGLSRQAAARFGVRALRGGAPRARARMGKGSRDVDGVAAARAAALPGALRAALVFLNGTLASGSRPRAGSL